MSAGEVGSRIARESRHRADDLLYAAARPIWGRTWAPGVAEIDPIRSPSDPIGILTRERARIVRALDPTGADLLVDAAEEVLTGRFTYFGHGAVELASPVDFNRDPLSSKRWPDRHGKRLDYRADTPGDPKWAWELNRLQELPLLVAAWLLAGEDRFVRHALTHARRWIATSAPGRGVAWSNGYEAALRAVSLTLLLDATRGSDLLEQDDTATFVESLWQHARWIQRDPSTHSSANNHRIGELVGLVAIGLLVPELRSSVESEAKALTELEVEAGRQIAADGTSVEQSFRYHLYVVDHLLLVAALLEAQGRETPPGIIDALGRSAEALSQQFDDDEPEPRYGDADDGRVVRLDGLELRSVQGVAAALAAGVAHPGARRIARRLDTSTVWLFGANGAARFDDVTPSPEPTSALLPDAGLVCLRRGRLRLLFDAGPLGYLSIAAHGHADALQLTLSEGPDELVVDPGTGSYFAKPGLRAAFRGTAFHATVNVDGVDQSQPGGPFLWRRHARTRLLRADLDGGVLLAEHDGYQRLPDPVLHRRLVVARPGEPVVVHDRLHAAGLHRAVQSWPLHPSLGVLESDSNAARIVKDGRPRMLVAVAATAAGALCMVKGQELPPLGWYSRRLESFEPAFLVTWEVEGTGPVDLVALLWPLDNEPWPEPRLAVQRSGSSLRVRFEGRAGPTELELDPDNDADPARGV
jgi:uncharacterized heparinase superfamily protein